MAADGSRDPEQGSLEIVEGEGKGEGQGRAEAEGAKPAVEGDPDGSAAESPKSPKPARSAKTAETGPKRGSSRRGKKPKPLFYKIGEACKQLDIQPYVLRYWETEFPSLKPSKSRSGQRVYSQEELEVIRRIKQLLYEEGYTIAGAKKKLEAELAAGGPGAAEEAPPAVDTRAAERIEHLRRGIGAALGEAREILALLDRDPRSS